MQPFNDFNLFDARTCKYWQQHAQSWQWTLEDGCSHPSRTTDKCKLLMCPLLTIEAKEFEEIKRNQLLSTPPPLHATILKIGEEVENGGKNLIYAWSSESSSWKKREPINAKELTWVTSWTLLFPSPEILYTWILEHFIEHAPDVLKNIGFQ